MIIQQEKYNISKKSSTYILLLLILCQFLKINCQKYQVTAEPEQILTNEIKYNQFEEFNLNPKFAADFDGDGLIDFLSLGSTNIRTTFQNSGQSFSDLKFQGTYFSQSKGYGDFNTFPIFVKDVNGNGRADLIAINHPSGTGRTGLYVTASPAQRSNEFKSLQQITDYFQSTGVSGSKYSTFNVTPYFVGNISGPGTTSVIGIDTDGRQNIVEFSNNLDQIVQRQMELQYGITDGYDTFDRNPRFLADIDGDGKDDFIGFKDDVIEFTLSAQNNDGDYTFLAENKIIVSAPNQFVFDKGWTSQNTFPRMMGDINGDGKKDIIGIWNDNIYYRLSTGNGFDVENIIQDAVFHTQGGYLDFDKHRRQMIDFDGDGIDDIIIFGTDDIRVQLLKFTCSSVTRDVNNYCECNIGYYNFEDNAECPNCDIQCQSCESQKDYCLQCQGNDRVANSEPTCQCISGYYQVNTTSDCQQCDYFCENCENQSNECLECKGSNRNPKPTCDCLQGYFDQGNQINCSKCNYNCLNCENNMLNCTECKGLNRNLTDLPNCSCLPGYYDDNTQNQDCQKCDHQCQTCIALSNNCQLCKGNFRDNDSKPECPCITQYYDDGVNSDCKKCDEQCDECQGQSNICQQCSDTFKDISTLCLSCLGDKQIDSLNNCECSIKGTYNDNSSIYCQSCHSTCYHCTLQNNCEQCQENRIQDTLNLMQCKCPQYSVEHENTNVCSYCDKMVIYSKFYKNYQGFQIEFPLKVTLNIIEDNEINLNEQSNYLCNQLFQQQTLNKLGSNCQCFYSNNNKIDVVFGRNPTLIIDDLILLNTQKINFTATLLDDSVCQTNIQEFHDTKVQLDQNPFPPSVNLIYPNGIISTCEQVQINVLEIQNDGNRGLQNQQWALFDNQDDNIDKLNTIFNNHKNQNQLIIPQLTLSQFKEYVFIFTYKNFAGIQGSSSITIQSGTNKGIKLNILQDQAFTFKNYQLINFETQQIYQDCFDGTVKEYEKQLILNYKILDQNKNDFKLLADIETKEQSQEYDIDKYTHLAGNSYFYRVDAYLSEDLQVTNYQYVKYDIEIVPLFVEIKGGNRMNAYAKPLVLESEIKDMNLKIEEQEQGITQNWTCQNMNTQGACTYQDGTPINLDQSSNIQNYPKKVFFPYNSYLFEITASKAGFENQIGRVIIIIVETDIPLLTIDVPQSVKTDIFNTNETLEISVHTDSNQSVDSFFYSLVLMYDYEVVATKNYEYPQFAFQIWDMFNDIDPNITSSLLVRISLYDPQYFMPSQSSFNIEINLNPIPGTLNITTDDGQNDALKSIFKIKAENFYDDNLPLQYKFIFYNNINSYQNEVKFGSQDPLNIEYFELSDYQLSNEISCYLPSSYTFNESLQIRDEILFMVIAKDSKGAITNITQSINIQIPNNIEQNLIDFYSNNIENTSQLDIKAQNLNILSQQLLSLQNISELKQIVFNNLKEMEKQTFTLSYMYNQILRQQNQLLDSDPNLEINNLDNEIENLNIIVQQNQDKIQKTIELDLLNQGDSKIQSKNRQLNTVLGNSVKLIDHIFEKNTSNNFETQMKTLEVYNKIQSTLQLDKLPNSDPIQYQGQQLRSKMQKCSPKKILSNLFYSGNTFQDSQQIDLNDENTDINEQGLISYETSQQVFQLNPYQNDIEFPYQDQITKMQSINIQDLQNNEQIIDPQGSIFASNVKKFVNYNFTPIDNNSDENQENSTQQCISKNSDSNKWDSQNCSTIEQEQINGETTVECQCFKMEPVSVINDINNLFSNSSFSKAFSDDGLSLLGEFQFWKSIIFYTFILITMLLLLAIYLGQKQDKKDIKYKENVINNIQEKIQFLQKQLQQDNNQKEKNNNQELQIEQEPKTQLNSKQISQEPKKLQNYSKFNQESKEILDKQLKINQILPVSEPDQEQNQHLDLQYLDQIPLSSLGQSQNSINKNEQNNSNNKDIQNSNQSITQIQQNSDQNSDQNYTERKQIQQTQTNQVIDNPQNGSQQNSESHSFELNFKKKSALKKPTKINNFPLEIQQQQLYYEEQELDTQQDNSTQLQNVRKQSNFSNDNSPFNITNDYNKLSQNNTPSNRKFVKQQNKKKLQKTQFANDFQNQETCQEIQIQTPQSPKPNFQKQQNQEIPNQELEIKYLENLILYSNQTKKQKQNKEYKIIQRKNTLQYVLLIHEFLGIYYSYQQKFSRPERYACFYLKLCLLLCISSTFSSIDNMYFNTLISLIISVFISIPVAVQKVLLSQHKQIFTIFGVFIYIISILICLYVSIINSVIMGVEQSNNWTFAFISSIILDQSGIQMIIGYLKLKILNISSQKSNKFYKFLEKNILQDDLIKYHFTQNIFNYDEQAQ